jgi:hypothetical protein
VRDLNLTLFEFNQRGMMHNFFADCFLKFKRAGSSFIIEPALLFDVCQSAKVI